MPKIKINKEFEEKKSLLDLKRKYDRERHEQKMLELQFLRDTEEIKHNNEMERQRIKSAEIRKMQERRELSRMGNYG